MPDWSAIARARGVDEAAVKPLETLDRVFRPLLKDLSPEVDPATLFDAEDAE